jgi:hypothetical protein
MRAHLRHFVPVTRYYKGSRLIALFLLLLLSDCKQLTPLFDSQAYNYAISLKVESAFLMKKATTPYSLHAENVEELQKEIEKAYLYEKGRGEVINKETLVLWDSLRSETAGLLGEFLKDWREADDGTLREPFVTAKVKQVGEAFDIIIRVENARRRESFDLGESLTN